MRVISGRFRSRTLRAPSGHGTRPTTDRVREAWFSILGDVGDAHVLDLFAGTGALGIEAVSRGARSAVFVDSSRAACQVIHHNLKALDLEPVTQVLHAAVERARLRIVAAGPFDVLLSDPPWTDLESAMRAQLRLLRDPCLMHPGGRVVLGHPKGGEPELASEVGLLRRSTRSWGDSAATFYEVPGTSDDSRADPRGG